MSAGICRSSAAFAPAALSFAAPGVATAQESEGSAWTAAAGGALGLYAGATLANVGSIVPCTQTYAGPTCVRWSSVTGGAVGLSGGLLLGAADPERVGDAALGAGIGFLAGSVAGLLLRSTAQRVGWADVATLGLVGGATGTAPRGAAIGLAAGGAIGLILWRAADGFELPDALGAAVAGLAIGGITQWLLEGIDAQTNDVPALQVMAVSLRF
jgi:hypothetical protein